MFAKLLTILGCLPKITVFHSLFQLALRIHPIFGVKVPQDSLGMCGEFGRFSVFTSHCQISRLEFSKMCSTVRTFLTGLQVQSAAILASDFDDLPQNLCIG